MAINETEFKTEEKILKKVQKLLGETLSDLGEEVYADEENLIEFKLPNLTRKAISKMFFNGG